MNLLGNFIAVDFKNRYHSLICTYGQVLTNMNNPLRDKYPDYKDIPQKEVKGNFVTADSCALYSIKNFGKENF